MFSALTNAQDARPRFEYYPLNSPQLRSVEVDEFPFVIGRGETATLQVNSTSVSREHAEVTKTPTGYRLRDLGSTNGTSVNGQATNDSPLADGDSVSVADIDLTFVCTSMGRLQRTLTRPLARRSAPPLPRGIPREVAESRGMSEALLYQCLPIEWSQIVHHDSQQVQAAAIKIASPLESWMQVADSKDPAAVASRLESLAWQLACEQADQKAAGLPLLLGVAQRETYSQNLLSAIETAAAWLPTRRRIGISIHWEWTTDAPDAARVCQLLRDRGVMLSVDGFAGGGACIDAMQRFPPDYLVFAERLIRGIATQPRRMQQLGVLQANCEACGINTVMPASISHEDELACGQIGIGSQRQNATPQCSASVPPEHALA
ncbi:ABC transporter ATP-binding/permease protein [Posidoniimonas polymericola]|uniref:ABC transporter ATP-binding/permease protein n=1 Tax=Posidoniimonas polymericola TaxID=2528002 RepID=A0A5C5XYH7_9BACT|nr:FHA domain-containing protein [Posidoniimonas polymericola]TWT67758.1 ABC transporter ATP-binding/permease protein [Posidoniimonas polymericola]